MKPLNIIVAVDENGGFGYQGNIPWKNEPFSKDDFKRFKTITQNSVCVMGHKTYEEILAMKVARGGDPNTPLLSGRESFVITSRAGDLPTNEAVSFAASLRDAVERFAVDETKQIFVLGGEKMFIEALPWTINIYMTVVKRTYQCDKFFPMDYVDQNFKLGWGEQTDDLQFLILRRFR